MKFRILVFEKMNRIRFWIRSLNFKWSAKALQKSYQQEQFN
jgi:hypothetical protein